MKRAQRIVETRDRSRRSLSRCRGHDEGVESSPLTAENPTGPSGSPLGKRAWRKPGRLILDVDEVPDPGVAAHGLRKCSDGLGVRPDEGGVVEGIGHGGGGREQLTQSLLRRGIQIRKCHAEVVGQVGGNGRVTAGAREERRTARIAPAQRQRPRGLEQLQRLLHHDTSGLGDQRREDRLISHQCSRVCRAHGRTAHAAPGLEYDDTHVTLGASGERLAPGRAITVSLDVERDCAHAFE